VQTADEKYEAAQAEIVQAETAQPAPEQAVSAPTEPVATETAQTGPGRAEPAQAGPAQAEPVQAEKVHPDDAPQGDIRVKETPTEGAADAEANEGVAGRKQRGLPGYLLSPRSSLNGQVVQGVRGVKAVQAAKAARHAKAARGTKAAQDEKAAQDAKTVQDKKAAQDVAAVQDEKAVQDVQAEAAIPAEGQDAQDVVGTQEELKVFLETLDAARTQARARRKEARQAYEQQKETVAAARKAKKEAAEAYEQQKSAVARLRVLKKRLNAENGVVFLADRRARNHQANPATAPQAAVARKKAGKRAFSRGAARGRLVVQSALKWIGTPYSWGGGNASGPSYGIGRGARTRGFDCSGLALYAWAQAGVKLDHFTGSQWNSGPRIPFSMMSPGDLVFFASNTRDPDTIHHVGIFIGRGRMVEAPYTGAHVRIASIWRKGLIGAVRPA
jgi:cell wall-associated NlpC family hydrolase